MGAEQVGHRRARGVLPALVAHVAGVAGHTGQVDVHIGETPISTALLHGITGQPRPRAAQCRTGSSISTIRPPSLRGRARIVPPWAAVIERAIDMPRPAPPLWFVRSALSRRKGSNRAATASAGTSWPVLRTESAGPDSASPATSISTQPPGLL